MDDKRVKPSRPDSSATVRKAVALEYDGIRAPRVTASGEAQVADEILMIAHDNEVPIVRNDALTEQLSQLQLQDEIPDMLYLAIAEVLAFSYQLQDLMWVDEEES